MTDSILETVRGLVREYMYLDCPELRDDENLINLGLDSLNLVALINRIEAEFDIDIDFRDMFFDPTVSELASLVRTRIFSR